MDPKTEEALRLSIAKWKANASATIPSEVKLSSSACPLCEIFNNFIPSVHGVSDKDLADFHDNVCRGCPVHTRTGKMYCSNTPYEACENFYSYWLEYPQSPAWQSEFHSAAAAEVSFLESLLPPEPQT